MDIIPFPGAPRRTGFSVEVFDDRGTPHIVHSFDITCPNCGHINNLSTGKTAIIRRVEIYCGCCTRAIKVSNPGIKSKHVPE